MKVRLQCNSFDPSAALEAFVEKRVSKLERFHPDIITADVLLSVEKPETNHNKNAKISLAIKGVDPFAEKQADTFEEAVSLVCEALEKQLERLKEKNKAK